jgi:phosphoribosylaminoimidazole-succinocarboxamide synthase
VTAELERLTRLVYGKGRDVAAAHGIIIADTKFEFGRTRDGKIILIDEVMTPDSSRFWPADGYQPGAAAQLRQAAVARLARCRASCRPLERRRAAAEAAARGRGGDQQAYSLRTSLTWSAYQGASLIMSASGERAPSTQRGGRVTPAPRRRRSR